MTRMAKTPYKIVPYEPDAADGVDRETGQPVGYVVKWAHGWSAYMAASRGDRLSFGSVPFRPEVHSVVGRRRDLYTTRYRADAAAEVWHHWEYLQTEGGDDGGTG